MPTRAEVVAIIDERLNGHGEIIVDEAHSEGLDLDLACALVEQESHGRNIFGCDHGPIDDRPPYCHQQVTPERVRELMDSPFMNGVGLTQLTWFTFVEDAEAEGGAHEPQFQCRVGFRLLAGYLDKYPYMEALGAYNAGEADRRSVLGTYAAQLAERHSEWKTLVASGVDADLQEKTNFDRGIEYLLPAVGKTRYWFWPPNMDIVPDGPGAYAVNRDVPDIEEVIEGGIFCQGVINLIRRANRKIVPTMGDERYDGGTWAAQNYWAAWSEPYSRWAQYPRGTLVGRNFVWAGFPGASEVLDQGHVAVLMGEQNLAEQKDPMILHSHPHPAVDGLNYTRLGESHNHWYYQYAIRPENWINHDKSNF